jgi:hypothetical protein
LSTTIDERLTRLQQLLSLVAQAPAEWATEAKEAAKRSKEIQPFECTSLAVLMEAWRRALRMRQELEDVFLVMLAICLSTEQEGDQLFLQVVGVPGTCKTTFCDALLVSKTCYPLEHLTGFHSGSVDSSGDDFSLISRIDRKTMVTSEGDVVMSSPVFDRIMSEQRRIFDGTSGAAFKNMKVDQRHTGLRTPWILAATPGIIEKKDQSQLGDRFLRVRVEKADPEEERLILRHVSRSAARSVRRTSNCSPDTQMSPEKSLAYRLTGGYVDHLRQNAERLLNTVEPETDEILDQHEDFGAFTAYMRARPVDERKRDELEAEKELPSRLTHQYVRLGSCLAAVMQRPRIDKDVMRIVRKVAIDTSRIRMIQMVGQIFDKADEGCYTQSLATWNGYTAEKMQSTLKFLLDIGAVENYRGTGPGSDAHYRWQLSTRMRQLWKKVHGL